ncbi:MAG: DUF445 family protein [Defluviitaleaceae bacterium]|nr:DUF445 family protein [Defluviitaleaceae bacterium]MCL2276145.1 DUF445 family protein [Defluviitaleaceae bacterium]
MQILSFLIPPVLGAIIALSTNWIAIVMLFRPHREVRLFGIKIPFTPGLVPRERARLGRKLGEAIGRHLLTPEVLADTLADLSQWPLPNFTVGEALGKIGLKRTERLKDALKKAADYLVENAENALKEFPTRFPVMDQKLAELTSRVVKESVSGLASMFVKKDKVYGNIKDWLIEYLSSEENREALRTRIYQGIDNIAETYLAEQGAGEMHEKLLAYNIREVLNALPLHKIMATIATYVAKNIPIADMVERKMATYDVAEAEAMILSVVGRELKIIVALGGVFGFLIGLLSVILL